MEKNVKMVIIAVVIIGIIIGAVLYYQFYYPGKPAEKTEILIGAPVSISGQFSKLGEEIKRFYVSSRADRYAFLFEGKRYGVFKLYSTNKSRKEDYYENRSFIFDDGVSTINNICKRSTKS